MGITQNEIKLSLPFFIAVMIKKYQNEIGNRLKQVRKFLHLTQIEIAKETGLSIGFIS